MRDAARRRRLVEHLERTAHVVFDLPVEAATRRATQETADLMQALERIVLEPHETPVLPRWEPGI